MLILASQSPRRAELLTQIGVKFIQESFDIDETPRPKEQPVAYVSRMALEKSNAALGKYNSGQTVLSADTIVVNRGQILGKPRDQQHAFAMLKGLSNCTHKVITAVCVANHEQQELRAVETEVTFGSLTDKQIDWYWHTQEPQDKAGGYGIQGLGGQFVEKINGSYSAVVGLPLYETRLLLQKLGALHEC